MSLTNRSLIVLIAAGVLVLASVARVTTQDPLAGAWTLESYRGSAAIGPASGQMIFADGRFALVYRMAPDGVPPSGRAHAGAYKLDGSALVLHVEYSMDHISGKGSVSDKTSDRRVKAEVNGNQLTMTFENGSVQTFTRARR